MTDRFAVVLGTRPEIIKLAGVLELLGDRAVVIHTGQHYDDEMSQIFLDDFDLPAPEHRLLLGGQSRAEQIGLGTAALGSVLADVMPRAVVVQGDTNSALAGALAANSLGLPLAHVEAGLRSFDRAMPEEHNRVLIDHLADFLAAPTQIAAANLDHEGIAAGSVAVTGNTVVEAVHRQLPGPEERRAALLQHGLNCGEFVLATIHRPENTDDPAVLRSILRQLRGLAWPTVLPLHPRTAAAVNAAGLSALLDDLIVVAPLSGPDFLALAAEAALIVSDSGGVQEEVTVLGRPLVVVRRSSERPEALIHHAVLVHPEGIAVAAAERLSRRDELLAELAQVPSPYGDGMASKRIADELRRRF